MFVCLCFVMNLLCWFADCCTRGVCLFTLVAHLVVVDSDLDLVVELA